MEKKYKHLVSDHIKASEQDGKVVIEGFANKYVVDEIGDLLEPTGCMTERYDQNPMILFNHDRYMPIGKAIELKKMPNQGLWVKAVLSSSDTEQIKAVNDLVKEGILSTFSVGYSEKLADKNEAGHNVVKQWDLHEISIVTIPMNASSTFSIAKNKALKDAFKSGDKVKLKHMALVQKAAMVADLVWEHLNALSEEAQMSAIKDIAEMAQISEEQLHEILSGNVVPVPEPVLVAISEVLGLNIEHLQSINAPKEEKPQEEKPPEESKESAVQACVSEKIPKLLAEGKPQDQAVAIAISMCNEEHGAKCEFSPEQIKTFLKDADSVTVPVQTTPDSTDYGNPHIELMKQQIVLLGVIANELKMLRDTIGAQGQPAQKPEQTPAPQEPAKSGIEERVKAAQEALDCIIKKLG